MHACVLVLVPTDDERRRLASLLESQGHAPLEAASAPRALEVLGGIRPDLVVLSASVVDPWRATGHGEGALLAVEPHPEIPCLVPPYTRTQFLEAVREALGDRRPVFRLGDRTIDLHLREARGPDGDKRLSPTECDFLSVLFDRRGRVVLTAELVAAVWGHAGASTVSVTARRVRNKIEPDPAHPLYLRTVHGVGLELHIPERATPASKPLLGRTALLEDVRAALQAHRIVTLFGPPGVGASTLARAAQPEAVPVDLSEARNEGDIAAAVTRALSIKREAKTSTVAILANNRRPLLLDNADPVRALLGELLAAASLQSPETQWLVTAHAPLTTGTAIPVPPLALEDAVAFLLAEVPDLEKAEEVAKALDGLPLALALAAPVLRMLGPDPLLHTWATRFALLDGRLDAAFETCWERLSGETMGGMARLAMADGLLGISDALELAGPQPLMASIDAGLVQRNGSEIELLGSVRAFVLARVDASRLQEARASHLAWVLERRTSVDDALRAAEYALSLGEEVTALDLLLGLEVRMRTQGDIPRWTGLLQRTVEQLEPEQHPIGLGTALCLLGAAALPNETVARPLLERALSIATQHALPEVALRAHTRLGDAAFYNGEPERAATHFEKLPTLAPGSEYAPFAHFRHAHFLTFGRPWDPETDARLEAAVHAVRSHPFERMNTAMLRAAWLERIGRGAEAVHHYRDCLAVARRANDEYSLARFLCTAGGAYVQQGRADAAQAMLDEALALRRNQAHIAGIASCLGNLSELAALQGNLQRAEQILDDAAGRFASIGHRNAEALCGINKASLWATACRFEDAEAQCEKTQSELEAVGMRGMGSHLLHTRSQLAAARGDLDRAGVLAAEALSIAKDGRAVRAELAAEAWALSLLSAKGAPEVEERATELLERARRAGSFKLEGAAALTLLRLSSRPEPWVQIIEQTLSVTHDPTLRARLDIAIGRRSDEAEADVEVGAGRRAKSLKLRFDLDHLAP